MAPLNFFNLSIDAKTYALRDAGWALKTIFAFGIPEFFVRPSRATKTFGSMLELRGKFYYFFPEISDPTP